MRPADEDEPVRATDEEDPRTEAERARRRARVFGEVLPETTGDERARAGELAEGDRDEEWLRANVPPHHGS